MACTGAGVPLSLFARVIQKVVLDATGFVQFRNPYGAGGAYYCFNEVMTHVACFVSATLYSVYFGGIARNADNTGNHTTQNFNYTGVIATNRTGVFFPAADSAWANPSKIDEFTLFATIATLSAVWLIAFVGLLLTMKREYVGSFVSLQTGCALSRSHFLDHEEDDARRTSVFCTNERHWRSIRELVRQWVLGAYATWLLMSPAWLNDGLRALIPDDFMPAPVVQQLHAQTPGGRRLTLQSMGTLRRMSLALAGAEPENTASDGISEVP
jgi:hypothetical protein